MYPREEVPVHGFEPDATTEVVSPPHWKPVNADPGGCSWEYTGWGDVDAHNSIGETSETHDTLTIDGEVVLRGDIRTHEVAETLEKWGQVKSRTEVDRR